MNTESLNLQSNLTSEETINPLTVIEQFFHHYTLPECRGLLREILHQALSGYNNRDGMNPADLLRFLEELEKAVEAVWVMSGQQANPDQKR